MSFLRKLGVTLTGVPKRLLCTVPPSNTKWTEKMAAKQAYGSSNDELAIEKSLLEAQLNPSNEPKKVNQVYAPVPGTEDDELTQYAVAHARGISK